MLFDTPAPLPLLTCAQCQATGRARSGQCRACAGLAVGRAARGQWLYWGFPLDRYHLALAGARRRFNKIRWWAMIIAGLNFWLWAGVVWYSRGLASGLTVDRWPFSRLLLHFPPEVRLLWWLGILCFTYAWYRTISEREAAALVERHQYQGGEKAGVESAGIASWVEVLRLPKKKRLNIATTFTAEASQAVAQAYLLADRARAGRLQPLHLFSALLGFNRVSNIFIRLGIPVAAVEQALQTLEPTGAVDSAVEGQPLVSPDFQQALFLAYEEAYQAHQEYVSVTELLIAAVQLSPPLQEMLFDLGVEKQKLLNAVEWARIRERLYRQYRQFRTAARHRSTTGMDRAMTALATPYLNQFSDDLTLLAQFGHTEPCLAREREMEEIFRVVEGGSESVLLVGDFGVGKRSVVEGIAARMVADDVPLPLRDKRLVRLSVPTLLSGTTPAGAVERLIHIMQDIARARNVILFIHNLHELVGVSAGGAESLDVAGTLAEYLSGGRFLTLATTTREMHAKHIANSKLSTVFAKVDIPEMDVNQAIQVLESKVGMAEYKHRVFFSYAALEKAVQLAARFLHDILLPGSALEVMTEAASYTSHHKGGNALVGAEEVAAVVAAKTKIPMTTVSADETTKLLHLEEAMHQRVIGQDEAVTLVANALRRSRAEIRSTSRPIANFLFLGPTGVGKTELAKTIAAVYFGGEERMTRLDMSEYQDTSSIYRLIGTTGQKGSGILTETIRRNPFALLLLDEIEKADKNILNLFLQVMDDGRLTDSTGRVVDFTNVILIATSNAGTQYVQEQMRAGVASEAIKERLLHGELSQYFRPEFLNRFDGIVLFKALSQDDIKKVAGLMLKAVAKDLEVKGITLEVEPAALDFLASAGFDPEFGARPMRRALQERVENQLAALLLQGGLKRRDTVVIGESGAITVKH